MFLNFKKLIVFISIASSLVLVLNKNILHESVNKVYVTDFQLTNGIEHDSMKKTKQQLFENTRFCVVVSVFNPAMYKSRYESYRKFKKYIESFSVQLITVELAFQNQIFQVTNSSNPNHIQLRTNDVLWYKENLINIGIRRSPAECVYIAWLDLEVEFQNRNWIQDSMNALEKFKTIQLFEMVNTIGPDAEILTTSAGFGYCFASNQTVKSLKEQLQNKYQVNKLEKLCTSGYAWAAKKSTLLEIDGLFDYSILGDGDYIAANSFMGNTDGSIKIFKSQYRKVIIKWQENVKKHLSSNIGYITGVLNHLWHGSMKDRKYGERRKILFNSNVSYNPLEHVYYDHDGLLHFTDAGREIFSTKIMNYFLSRNEDNTIAQS